MPLQLLDSGALRSLVAMGAAVSALPGGLATLMASCGRELPLAAPHTELSAAGVASGGATGRGSGSVACYVGP